MDIKDIIALAKQGYKPTDIKELINLANEQQLENNSTSESESLSTAPSKSESQDVATKSESVDNSIEEIKAQLEEAQAKVKELQSLAENKDISNSHENDEEKTLEDMVRGLMI